MRVQFVLNKSRISYDSGFTLVEMMVVVGIIGILTTVALSNYSGSRTRAKITAAMDEMRTLATGIELYRTEYNAFPHAFPIQGYDEEKYLKDQLKETERGSDWEKVIEINKDLLNLYVPPKFDIAPHYSKKIYENKLAAYKITEEQFQPGWGLEALIKPLGYIREIPLDIFHTGYDQFHHKFHYYYYSNNSYSIRYFREHISMEYYLFSTGPDNVFENSSFLSIYPSAGDDKKKKLFYTLLDSGQFNLYSENFITGFDVTNGLQSHGDIFRKGP